MPYALTPSSILSSLHLFSSAAFLAFAAACDGHDKAALIEIKAAFGNPAGLSSWTSGSPCCSAWSGVECDSTTGRVTSLTVFALNVSASVPPAIANLSALQSLNLAYNRLYGPLPAFLGPPHLPDLSFLRLDGNRLSGRIPATLTVFDLSLVGNRLSGPLPPSFAGATFGDVDLGDNRLTGDASFLFGHKKKLNALNLERNRFEFDLSRVQLPKVMDILKIAHNMIYGRIPAEAAHRKWLQFDVSYNRLCGPIPQSKYIQQFGASHFDHNKCLCGPPLAPCS
ncbi:polygalacturonase inhibitor-like isoform X2 [Ananas comosus]|uniref:Polygalacturonase inhibitor-like isoform X2 n=1 Tax=Ananas comosus TaxID=4615 RepID=A0A6P5EVZ8_ANACO|nr:polygalacturonase inhibitor-like isoform X2 [Ananas comosus]